MLFAIDSKISDTRVEVHHCGLIGVVDRGLGGAETFTDVLNSVYGWTPTPGTIRIER